jgi:hypothetical protein
MPFSLGATWTADHFLKEACSVLEGTASFQRSSGTVPAARSMLMAAWLVLLCRCMRWCGYGASLVADLLARQTGSGCS